MLSKVFQGDGSDFDVAPERSIDKELNRLDINV